MELMYPIVIILGIVAILILSFIKFNKKDEYQSGKKVINPEYIQEEKYVKKKMKKYRILVFFIKTACVVSIVVSLILAARPYTIEVTNKEQYSRDIILCIDISYSVDELNQSLVGGLKETVNSLRGERFGIVIFNSSPVLLVPLTDDYEYVIDELDKLEKALDMRQHYLNSFGNYDYKQGEYLIAGTDYGSDERGSSLIPEGMASAVYNFPDIDEDRTRIMIFSTDNDLQGEPMLTLDAAADICKKNSVVVYGIGTENMTNEARLEMKAAVEKTGGTFYLEEHSGTVKEIVEQIDNSGKNLVKGETQVKKIGKVTTPFILLVLSVTVMIILTKRAKL